MKRFFFLAALVLACTCVRAQSPSAYVIPTEDEFKTGFALSNTDPKPAPKDTAYTRVFLIENELNLEFLVAQLNRLLMNQPLATEKTIVVSVAERKID